jgi:hypothetical protein
MRRSSRLADLVHTQRIFPKSKTNRYGRYLSQKNGGLYIASHPGDRMNNAFRHVPKNSGNNKARRAGLYLSKILKIVGTPT